MSNASQRPIDEPVILPYAELSSQQCAELFAVRHDVFVGEQQIHSEPDRDGRDPDCLHVLALDEGVVVGTCRLLDVVREGRRWIKVGRLAVRREARQRGVGRALVTRVNGHIAEQQVNGVMHAQAYLERWYASAGWHRVGDGFLEAGIDHVEMRYTPARSA